MQIFVYERSSPRCSSVFESQGDSYGTVESNPYNFHYAIGELASPEQCSGRLLPFCPSADSLGMHAGSCSAKLLFHDRGRQKVPKRRRLLVSGGLRGQLSGQLWPAHAHVLRGDSHAAGSLAAHRRPGKALPVAADPNAGTKSIRRYLDELKKEFLGSYGPQIPSTTRPYAFMKFEKFMNQTKKTFTENKSQHSLDLLGAELQDVRRIMTRNINDVLERGDKLQRSADESRRLVEDSAIYKKRAQDLNKCLWLRQNAPLLFVSTARSAATPPQRHRT
eukprot:SAG22_NODE_19_length_32182_cov_39.206963_2_plen_277_part_00